MELDLVNILFIIIIVAILASYLHRVGNDEEFYIEPNMIEGGAVEDTTPISGPNGGVLELEGPGNAAWSGY
jgi:hypothetical protein